MLNTIKSQLEILEFASEKRCIRKLKEKLLGRKKGWLPEYNSLSIEASKYAIPWCERTYILNIEELASGEMFLHVVMIFTDTNVDGASMVKRVPTCITWFKDNPM